jgi:hypothetical protein
MIYLWFENNTQNANLLILHIGCKRKEGKVRGCEVRGAAGCEVRGAGCWVRGAEEVRGAGCGL